MGDVLDQSEVDALLAAVDSGVVAPPGASPSLGSPSSSSSSPLSSNRPQAEVQLYDFKRPERVSKDQMRALEALHDGFGRNLGAALSGYLRTIIEVTVAHIEQLTYAEFIHSLPNPTCFNLLKSDQIDGQLCLEISPLIVYPIIDRLLGGSNADLFIPQRPLTEIEQRLVQRITDRATLHLSEAWSNLTPSQFSVADFESNPQLVQIVPPNETVVVVGFELKMGSRAGTMSLCIPYNTLEPLLGKLSAQNWFSYQRRPGEDDTSKKLTRNIHTAPVELRALVAQTTITMNDLLSLQVGDVITTSKPANSEILLQIEGRGKFLGRIGQFRNNKALRITRSMRQTSDPATTINPSAAAEIPKPPAAQPNPTKAQPQPASPAKPGAAQKQPAASR